MKSYRLRRTLAMLLVLLLAAIPMSQMSLEMPTLDAVIEDSGDVIPADDSPPELASIEIKGRAPKTNYSRSEFGNGWDTIEGCTMRNRVLIRDLTNVVIDDQCRVESGLLKDPYTGQAIPFVRGEQTSDDVQIDHVVALSNAWQTGAQQMQYSERVALANDPLNLIAVSGAANQQKSDGDAATWLPSNKGFRCDYVKRQVAVKQKYNLWATRAEYDTFARLLRTC